MKKIINKYHVSDAAKGNRIVLIDEFSIITPLARDMAKELGVEFVCDVDADSIKGALIDDIENFPLKR